MQNIDIKPDIKISIKQTFGIDSELEVDAFSKKNDLVPDIDKDYVFDRDTTLAILSGFSHNKKVIVHGYHGTGKSTHITQVAARLNWPCVRINLDSHISRIDLIGKDAINLKDGKQITEFKEGILPWSFQNPVALVFDEYDAGRSDVMFVLQRILESDGYFTLLDKNKVCEKNQDLSGNSTVNLIECILKINFKELTGKLLSSRFDKIENTKKSGSLFTLRRIDNKTYYF